MATILVTGGAGYVGSHTCKALAAEGYLPVTYDNLCRGHRDAVRWGPLTVGDLTNRALLVQTLRRYRPAAVLHFAAYAYVGEAVSDPYRYYRNNVEGTLSLLEAMREVGNNRIVFSSSCATYGNPQYLPIDEKHPQAPINPYGSSKLMVERILADAATAYGLNWVALRYFNAAGADPSGEIGEDHDPETHALPLAIQTVLGGGPFRIYGTDYPTADGTAVRDYIHVSDLAAAHVAALGYLKRGRSGVFNLGTGRGTSVRELAAAVERISGRRLWVREEPRRAGDPPLLVAAAARAGAVLGWRPRYTDINDIVKTAWVWHSARQRQKVEA